MTEFKDLKVEPFRFRWACLFLRLASPPISGTEPGSNRCGQGKSRHDASPGVNTLSGAQSEAAKSSSRAKVHLSLAPLQGQSTRARPELCSITGSLGQLCTHQQPYSKQGCCPGSNPPAAFHLSSRFWDAPERPLKGLWHSSSPAVPQAGRSSVTGSVA